MQLIGRLSYEKIDEFQTDTHSAGDCRAVQLLFSQHLKKICAFCHGYGHTEGRCTTRRAMWREANALSLRSTMGYLCGRLKVDSMEKGTQRKREYDLALARERENVRNNPVTQASPVRWQQPPPVVFPNPVVQVHIPPQQQPRQMADLNVNLNG